MVAQPSEEDPLAGLDEIEVVETLREDAVAGRLQNGNAEPGSCRLVDDAPTQVWPRRGVAAIVSTGEGFALAGYAKQDAGEEVFAVSLRSGEPPSPVLREELDLPAVEERMAPPGLSVFDSGHVGFAIVDGGSNARFAHVSLSAEPATWVDLGGRADRRFSPALVMREGNHFVAYTESSEPNAEGMTSMRIRLFGLEPTGRATARHLVVGPGGGATAATALEDHFYIIDPREGLSPVLKLVPNVGDFEIEPLGAVANLADPAQIAAVSTDTTPLIAYVAMGSGATTAVGLVAPGAGDPPQPIVPGQAYGRLRVAAARHGEARVFAAERAGEGGTAQTPRNVIVRVRTADGTLSNPLELDVPGEAHHLGGIAVFEGTFAVSIGSEDGIFVRYVRCAP